MGKDKFTVEADDFQYYDADGNLIDFDDEEEEEEDE